MKIHLLAVLFAVAAYSQAPPDPKKVLSVCDVLREDPAPLNGKMISVRGTTGSTGEGTYLEADCQSHLVSGGMQWPNDLWVDADESDPKSLLAFDRLSRAERRARVDYIRDKVVVTLVGKLETRLCLEHAVLTTPGGQRMHYGFGHLNGAPAAITVYDIKDIVIQRGK